MKQRYVVKGSNTLYQVWGIITFVFAGIYAIIRLIGIVSIGVAASMVPDWMQELTETDMGEMQIVVLLLLIFATLLGLAIRIMAGLYLVRKEICSKGALIFIAVCYFLMTCWNLFLMVLMLLSGVFSAFVLLTLFFFMGWSAATGVFLILKQARAIPEGTVTPFGKEVPRYRSVERADVPDCQGSPKAEIEGMFGNYKGKTFVFRGDESCRIGRDSGCDIQISHPKVSRIHCAVKALPDGKFEVTDYSYNGTFYENIALPNGKAVVVQAGGMLVLGSADNVFLLKGLQ